jgi:hypothetical protein
MPEEYAEKYLSKLILLEKRIGENTNYQILEPFSIGVVDIVSIQNAAKIIVNFIGLNELSFIVLITKQDEKSAGHIDFSHSGEKEIVVEISNKITCIEASVLAALSHEITHKYMQIK